MKHHTSKLLTRLALLALCAALLAALIPAAFAAEPTVVYLDGTNGADTNSGASADQAVKTLEKAYELACAAGIGSDANAEAIIVLCGETGVGSGNVNFNIPSSGKASYPHVGKLTVTSVYGSEDYRGSASLNILRTNDICYFQLGGPTVYENMEIDVSAGHSLGIYAGEDFTIGQGVTTTGVTSAAKLIVSAGWCRVETQGPANITVLSGNIGTITSITYAKSHKTVTGTCCLTIGGSAVVEKVVAGPAQSKNTPPTVASVAVTVNPGATVNSCNLGGANGTVTDSTLVLAGGTVSSITNSTGVTNAHLVLSGTSGDFTMPGGTWKTLTVTGGSEITLTGVLPETTALVVESGSTVTLAEGDNHGYTGEGTVIYTHAHEWVEDTAKRTGSTCTVPGTASYTCSIGSCTASRTEPLPLAHSFDNGVCTACNGKHNVVYVADGGTGDGYTAATPVGTLEDAYAALLARTDIASNAATEGTIIFCGVTTVDRQFNYDYAIRHAGTITYTGSNYKSARLVLSATKAQCADDSRSEHRFQLGGPTKMEDLTIDRGAATSASLTIYVPSTLEMAQTVQTVGTNWAGAYTAPVSGLTDEQLASMKLSAHRGYQPMGPENSVLSFQAAADLGFAYIECDVYRTADGELICIHDSTLDRTTNGTGDVTRMTYAEIRQYRIDTAGYGYDITNADPAKLYVPTFREYLEICKAGGCIPFIELKHYDKSVTEDIIEMALEYFPPEDIVISCISLDMLVDAHEINKDVFIHLIWGDQSDAGYTNSISVLSAMKNAAGETYAGIAFNITGLTNPDNYARAESWIARANAAGLKTCLRGADDMAQVRKMFDLGIDYYPTNTTSPEKLQQLKAGTEGGYTYTGVSGGKIFIRGGNRVEENTGDVAIVLNGGLYDFVAPTNAEQPTTGSYSVAVGGEAFVSRLIAGETATGASGDRRVSNVTVSGEAVVNNLYLAGDGANTREVNVTITGGKVVAMSENRGNAGTAQDLTLTLADVSLMPGTVSISNKSLLSGTKLLCLQGTGALGDCAVWDGLVALDGAAITLTGSYPENLRKEGSGRFLVDNQSFGFGTVSPLLEDGAPVALGSDIPYTLTGEGTPEVTWYDADGNALPGAPGDAGSYSVGVAVSEAVTHDGALVHKAVAEQTVSFTIRHVLTEVAAEAPACTEDGVIAHYACTVCGKVFADTAGETELGTVVDPAKGHTMVKTEAAAPTCTADGNVAYYTCTVCGKVFADAAGRETLETVVDPARGHELVKTAAKAPTTDAEGNTAYYTCAHCGKLYTDATAAKEITKADTVLAKLELPSDGSPETGETVHIPLMLVLLALSGLAFLTTAKRREY